MQTQAILGMVPLTDRLAQCYAGRGERVEDLAQVAALALVKAVDGYDPDRLAPFQAAASDLEQLRGRTPTPVELATYLRVEIDLRTG
ncbi:sigma factor [Dactylosporangium sp. NPDC048998]|uniref:sigma factor n=1 Tax=Dactylosporangium sp. NPDC048998 TaxID=3363976 RepID=UPI003724536C